MRWIVIAALLAACGGGEGSNVDGAGGGGGSDVEQPEERCVVARRSPSSDETIRVCMPEGWPYGSVAWDAEASCESGSAAVGIATWWRDFAGERIAHDPPQVGFVCVVRHDCLAPMQIDAPECCSELDPDGQFPIDCPAN